MSPGPILAETDCRMQGYSTSNGLKDVQVHVKSRTQTLLHGKLYKISKEHVLVGASQQTTAGLQCNER